MIMAPKSRVGPFDENHAVRYRDIRYPRLELKTGSLLLVLPKEYHDEPGLLEKHRRWVDNRTAQIQTALNESHRKKLAGRTEQEFRKTTGALVDRYDVTGRVNSIIYRRMKSKWASYSSHHNLTLNTLMRYLPNRLIEYIVFHELVHSKEKRHNAKFWALVEMKYKDHTRLEHELMVYWFLVQKKMGRWI
jgi:predicted metal-dependent hydrolase